jgi:glycerol kinase
VAESGVVLSLDEGTTGATAVAVGMDGQVRGKGYAEIAQHYPQPGWVEHDAEEIWTAVQRTARDALAAAGARPSDVRAIGITNQRETLVAWDRKTLKPLTNAIVWQDRRTAADCTRLREAGHEDRVREVTGLVLDPYFTATKLAWLVKHVDGAADAAIGTVDSWLVARLSAGRDHVTDASNASRTLLFDIGRGVWSEEMAALFGVQLANLPEVRDSSGEISRSDAAAFIGVDAPITGIAGDQQAALFGQACTTVGMAKNTYGTGSFVLMQTGAPRVPSKSGMRARGRHLHHRRRAAMAARWPGHHPERRRGRTDGGLRSGCRRRIPRPRLRGAGRPSLGCVRARDDRRAHARQRARPAGARGGGGHGLPDTRRGRGDGARHSGAPS